MGLSKKYPMNLNVIQDEWQELGIDCVHHALLSGGYWLERVHGKKLLFMNKHGHIITFRYTNNAKHFSRDVGMVTYGCDLLLIWEHGKERSVTSIDKVDGIERYKRYIENLRSGLIPISNTIRSGYTLINIPELIEPIISRYHINDYRYLMKILSESQEIFTANNNDNKVFYIDKFGRLNYFIILPNLISTAEPGISKKIRFTGTTEKIRRFLDDKLLVTG